MSKNYFLKTNILRPFVIHRRFHLKIFGWYSGLSLQSQHGYPIYKMQSIAGVSHLSFVKYEMNVQVKYKSNFTLVSYLDS